jgi:hypothetical protein
LRGITIPDEHLKLMDIQTLYSIIPGFRPPFEFSLGQPFLAYPESLTIVTKDFHGCSTTIKKNKQVPGKRIGFEYSFTKMGQAINSLSKINRFHRKHNFHMRGDLNHDRLIQKDLPNSSRSKSVLPLKHILIFAPFPSSISTTHSDTDEQADEKSNAINAATGSLREDECSPILFSTRSFKSV